MFLKADLLSYPGRYSIDRKGSVISGILFNVMLSCKWDIRSAWYFDRMKLIKRIISALIWILWQCASNWRGSKRSSELQRKREDFISPVQQIGCSGDMIQYWVIIFWFLWDSFMVFDSFTVPWWPKYADIHLLKDYLCLGHWCYRTDDSQTSGHFALTSIKTCG